MSNLLRRLPFPKFDAVSEPPTKVEVKATV
jgi:hypothetical protein